MKNNSSAKFGITFKDIYKFVNRLSPPIKNYVFVMLCAIWYHLYNSKNVKKKNHGRVLLLVKLRIEAVNLFDKSVKLCLINL